MTVSSAIITPKSWIRQSRGFDRNMNAYSRTDPVSRGKIHKYLGMTLDFTVRGHVRISVFDYVDEILSAVDKVDPKGAGTKTSAAPLDLFKVDEDCEKLPPKKVIAFHNLVAKILFATKRARPDTYTSISFLPRRSQGEIL
jgi:hypothetical protein